MLIDFFLSPPSPAKFIAALQATLDVIFTGYFYQREILDCLLPDEICLYPAGLTVGSTLQHNANIFIYSILHMRRWGMAGGERAGGGHTGGLGGAKGGRWRCCEEAAMLWEEDGMCIEGENPFLVQKGFGFGVWMVQVVKAP